MVGAAWTLRSDCPALTHACPPSHQRVPPGKHHILLSLSFPICIVLPGLDGSMCRLSSGDAFSRALGTRSPAGPHLQVCMHTGKGGQNRRPHQPRALGADLSQPFG